MALVSRNKIWFYAGDEPYIDLKIKTTQLFIFFKKKLAYYTPVPGELAILPDDIDDIDINVKQWLWWIILDDNIHLYCKYNGIHGITIFYGDKKKGSSIEIDVTENEAIEINDKINEMIKNANNAENQFIPNQNTIIKPMRTVIKYRVKQIIWKNNE